MLHIRSNSVDAKAAWFVMSICFAVAVVATSGTRKVQATKPNAVNSGTQRLSMSAPTVGKINGKIIFTSDRQNDRGLKLWTMNADGSNPLQLTDESDRGPNLPSFTHVYDGPVRWSPDGTKVAFRSIRNGDSDEIHAIYLMNPDGSDVHRTVIDSTGIKELPEIGSFNWSPDGTKLVFDVGAHIGIPESKLTTNIFTAGVDGKNLTQLTRDSEVLNGSPDWSPDGSMIAFVSNSQNGAGSKIQVMNTDGSNRRTIASGSSPAWSPDGSKILFVGSGQTGSCDTYICDELYTINSDGSNLAQLTSSPASYAGPRWSPDGKKIVFERWLLRRFATSVGDNGHAIFVMDADGSNQINISNRHLNLPGASTENDFQPDWQPLSAPLNDPPPGVLGFSAPLYCCSPSLEIRVVRSGNLNQAVSCDYQTERHFLVSAPVSLTFAPGETSKTIQVPYDATFPTTVTLSNNAGNATLVGGNRGTTVFSVALNSNPIDYSAFFVRQHYRDFLNRDPDPLGMDFWTNNLEFCGSECQQVRRINTSAAFFLSIEFNETGYLIYRTYKAAYGNLPGRPVPIKLNEFLPDTTEIGAGVIVGQANWPQRLETNKQNFMLELVQRSRFTLAYPGSMTPAQFVDGLFANAEVTPSTAERQAAIDEFAGAITSTNNAARARALRQVAENVTLARQEFNRAFVLMQYFGYLRRDPNSGPDADFSGYDFWLRKLNQFNGNFIDAEMVKAFISSIEYRQRFTL